MNHDIPGILDGLIIFGYLVIAWQFRRAMTGADHKPARRSLAFMVAIFVLCSVTGYLPHLFDLPKWLTNATGVALSVAVWAYITTRQARHIEKAFD